MAQVKEVHTSFRFSMRLQDGYQVTSEVGEVVILEEGDLVEIVRQESMDRCGDAVRAELGQVASAFRERRQR